MFDCFLVSTDDLVVRHTPDVLGVFEPLSELIFVNITNEQLSAGLDPDPTDAASLQVCELVHHEIYHYYQTFCTGFLYRQFLRLTAAWRATVTSADGRGIIAPRIRSELGRRVRAAGRFWMPRTDRAWFGLLDSLLAQERHVENMERLAAKRRERNLAGILFPGLHQAIETVRAPATTRGPSGLSAEEVYEGSAFIFGKLAAYGTDLEMHLDQGAYTADGPYGRLLRFSRDRMGDRATPSLVLLSAAVALRHEDPGETFGTVLAEIARALPESEPERARAVAGERAKRRLDGYLGTAWDVHSRDRGFRVRVYEEQIRAVHTGAWGLDELNLLSEPNALDNIPPGDLGFAIVTRDGQAGNSRDFGVRILIGTDMLPTGPTVASLRRGLAKHWRGATPFLTATFPGRRHLERFSQEEKS